jgi:hypothetical protein
MSAPRRLAPSVCLSLALACWACARAGALPSASALLHSRELWATIDVCSPPKEQDTIGIRGSMPGDGRPGDRMYMSFALQYLTAVNQWSPLPSSSSSYVAVGGAGSVRQGGWSFTLKPASGHTKYTIRGMVSVRWMRGRRVIAHALVPTTDGHKALAGANPPGYSAATCTIG